MAQTGELVSFKFGTQVAYDKIAQKDTNALYFCYDSARFYLGAIEYTRPVPIKNEVPNSSENYPPNSICVVKNEEDAANIYHTVDGKQWALIGLLPKKIIAGVVGKNTKTKTSFGDNIVIPTITYNDRGFITSSSDQNIRLPEVTINDEILSFDQVK